MEPREEEEASKMSDGRDDECVLVTWRLTNTVCERGKILVLQMSNPGGGC